MKQKDQALTPKLLEGRTEDPPNQVSCHRHWWQKQLLVPGGQRPQPPVGPFSLAAALGHLHCKLPYTVHAGTTFHSDGWHISFFPTQPSHPCFSAFSAVSPLIPACSLKLKAMGRSRLPLAELWHQRTTLRGTFLVPHIQSYPSKQHFVEVFSS